MKIIITLPHIRKAVSLKMYKFHSTLTFQLLFHFSGRWRLVPFMAS